MTIFAKENNGDSLRSAHAGDGDVQRYHARPDIRDRNSEPDKLIHLRPHEKPDHRPLPDAR